MKVHQTDMFQRLTDLGAATSAAVSIGFAHVIALSNDVPTLPADPSELLRWAMKESALLFVVLLVLFFYRRDFKNKQNKSDGVAKESVMAVRESVMVNTELRGQVARLARAIEEMNRRPRRTDPEFNDPEDHHQQGRKV